MLYTVYTELQRIYHLPVKLAHLTHLLFILFQTLKVASAHPSLFFDQLLNDYQAYYSIEEITKPLVGLGVSGLMANTDFDPIVRDEWQQHVRGHFTDQLSDNIDTFSEISQYKMMLPIYLASIYLGKQGHPSLLRDALSRWGNHSLRSLLLGAPQQAALCWMLGGGRPESGKPQWHLLRYHRAVSGHAFYGAIPLLNAAELATEPVLKSTFYLLSILPAIARINLDKHYASQVFLGWWLALMATQCVWKNDKVSNRPQSWSLQIIPAENAIFLGFTTKF